MRLGLIIMSQRIKKKSHQWVGPGSPRPKKFKTQPSAGKVMATVFWDAKGVIMLDFLPKRSTITGVYYANLFSWERRGKLSKGVLLQHDNAKAHTCKVAMDAVERNGYKLIPHPAYSPALAPSDFFLFPNLKKDIRGLHFRSDEELVTAVEEWVNGKDPDFFSSGLMVLEHCWSKCIILEGNYIDKRTMMVLYRSTEQTDCILILLLKFQPSSLHLPPNPPPLPPTAAMFFFFFLTHHDN